ncbi:peptidylprolyl isomerase [Maricaulis sp.]|uniref:peptidylprolyl isomerase n=1 Tax=Maricaulis sp. TaxID=1486257 RepID=UPI00262CAAD6|nr:peptidylprolyl isomerase [Maricaulis sp.]
MRLSFATLASLALATTACAREADTATNNAESAVVAGAAAAVSQAAAPAYDFPEEAWRDLDPENTLYIETTHGRIVVELAPEFAPGHVERMKTLARDQFYDFLIWHRVIEDFMAQGGGSRANPNHGTDLPNLQAEFTLARGPELTISELMQRPVSPSIPQVGQAGFWNSFHAGTQPIAQAMITATGQVQSWLLHCEGAAAMARTNDPNSAGSQFYITRGDAEHLNATYTVWGRVRHGQDAVNAIEVGTLFQDPGFTPDVIRSMRVEADIPEAERTNVQIVDSNHPSFNGYLDSLRDADGALPDVCDIDIPTRIQD